MKINMGVAYQEVTNVIEALQHARDDVETYHKQWFQLAVSLGDAVGVMATAPHHRCARQQHRDNVEADLPEEYYRCTITVPFLDGIVQHLKTIDTLKGRCC